MKTIKLQDLIDVRTLQKIQDGFSNVTGMAALTIDVDGNPFTTLSNPNEFCMKLTRETSVGAERCKRCDTEGGAKAMRNGRVNTYSCHAGLTDFAAPIVVDGMQIGSIIGGQVLASQPNEEKTRKIAKEIGISESQYVSAIKKVKVLTQKQIDDAAEFLYTIANVISNMAYKENSTSTGNTKLKGDAGELYSRINDIDQLNESNALNNKKLYDNYVQLSKTADSSVQKVIDTKDTVKVIQDIAMNTRILGFNASIEASRAKESGKGFGVIAQEVRSLADVSKSSADKIEDTIQAIGADSDEISQSIKGTGEIIKSNMEYTENVTSLLKEILSIAQAMK